MIDDLLEKNFWKNLEEISISLDKIITFHLILLLSVILIYRHNYGNKSNSNDAIKNDEPKINDNIETQQNELTYDNVNAKNREYRICSKQMANILHSTFGLDHYPKYLLRWNIKDITELEIHMQEQLRKIKLQKNALYDILNRTKNIEGILDKQLSDEMIFDKRLLNGIKKDNNGNFIWNYNSISKLLIEIKDGVYKFPLLNDQFCDLIVEHSMKYVNVLDKRFALDYMNLSWLNDLLLNNIIKPISNLILKHELHYNCHNSSDNVDRELDWRHGYLVGYTSKDSKDNILRLNSLVEHTDDSEVTLNVCLYDKFNGGELVVSEIRGNNENINDNIQIKMEKGYGILHIGRQFHAVKPVLNGKRIVLIVWTRNMNGLRNEVCPCCWINRRSDKKCICGSVWN